METSTRKSDLRNFGRDSYNETFSSHYTGFSYLLQTVVEAARKFGPLSAEDMEEVKTGWGDREEELIQSCEAFDLNEAERRDYGHDDDPMDEEYNLENLSYQQDKDTLRSIERMM